MLVVHKKLRGFTVGEVVLSSFVLTLGLTSAVSLISQSFRTSVDNQNVIIASELAQEGVELVRNFRDNNLVKKAATGSPDDVFTNFPSGTNNKCVISYNSTSLDCGGPETQLALSNGLYQASGVAGLSRFYRLLKIEHVPPSPTARVKSFVTWQDPGGSLNGGGDTTWCTLSNKCVYTEIFLTEWQ
ncbi:hypothetical protein E6Q11_02290 [Candidatus Dojkabacteria bacterium]|uniref:Type II secretion system protein n=1 Tax=Candidatus Dojkabacteria bacterium TaxID=2099670 RepID=A0A5C7J889_9BACT|nr:MAG: hypothetical protein E6Q11_02290 [Candidatus Dojkabacteria bacterium]